MIFPFPHVGFSRRTARRSRHSSSHHFYLFWFFLALGRRKSTAVDFAHDFFVSVVMSCGRITKRGNKIVHTTLVECALIAMRYNPYLRNFHGCIKSKHGASQPISLLPGTFSIRSSTRQKPTECSRTFPISQLNLAANHGNRRRAGLVSDLYRKHGMTSATSQNCLT